MPNYSKNFNLFKVYNIESKLIEQRNNRKYKIEF